MRFKLLMLAAAMLVALAYYFTLPSILHDLRSNPEIQMYLANPDLTFDVFSQCKKRVENADACYQAYSAAVQLSTTKNCSVEGIALTRRFKLLVGHSSAEVIESEISRDCFTAPK
ncbi:hypothetical protein [Pseudomonas paracarnis]|uniref:hypothetical protein n=1 Tax=Pseudomonas paracarnis TaxID=2750625 RepID=UPI0023DF7060|nr:hypothetical protein [Pseudomonas paracarnis]MDF3188003.1 hypothetical protein [Pseudomonas paracarnis]